MSEQDPSQVHDDSAQQNATSPKDFLVAFGTSAGIPLVCGMATHSGHIGNLVIVLLAASVLGWLCFAVAGIVALVRGARARGLSYLGGALAGAVVGFGACAAIV